jgi:acetoacetate decarboxylase
MRKEDILKLPSMPASGPSYPAGPYRFIHREFMVITYETDPDIVCDQLPEPLEPVDAPLVHYEWIKMPDSSGFGDYTESGMVLPCRFRGEEANFVVQMYLDDDPPISAGREIWGFPKKYAHPKLEIVKDTLTGTLEYARPARGHGNHGLQARSDGREWRPHHGAIVEDTDQPESHSRRRRTSGNLPARRLQSDRHCGEGLVARTRTPASCPHVNAPVADFPVRKIIGAHHFVADLTLPYGRVLYDYNKD